MSARLNSRAPLESNRPVLSPPQPTYEVGDRVVATGAGGLGAIHAMVTDLGLARAIDAHLHLLKRHLPYHESDHVLMIAYNLLAGGQSLEALEDRRRDEAFTNMLGATRLPDPTTAGDFLRRFSAQDVEQLMAVFNEVRVRVWNSQSEAFKAVAEIDIDGAVAPVSGEKKEGMELNYAKREWGYHPLLISLAKSREPLFIVNRPGNVPSHSDAAPWIDRAIDLALRSFRVVLLRGDTDFNWTTNFDRWTDRGVQFVFGADACKGLVERAEAVEESAWVKLARPPKYEVATTPRATRPNAKDEYIARMEWPNLETIAEEVAEIAYRPSKCARTYRLIVLRKTIRDVNGQQELWDRRRYFFYLTNHPSLTPAEIVRQSNLRCEQENLVEQLKNGLPALHAPGHDLCSNWAYMVIAALAWTLKSWFALTIQRLSEKTAILRMEFRRFLNSLMLIPAQVVRTGRRLVIRLLATTQWVPLLFRSGRLQLAGS